MFSNWMKQFECASASSAAASFSCANLFVMDAVLLASIIFILSVLDLHILGILVVLISILRIIVCKSHQPESLA
ncbi:MAG: hypothetical protein J6D61_03345 [Clostridia bacterium]|nr:hypothetical protein [Clostridia bacterium]